METNPAPGFMEAFTGVLKSFDFNGRARRAEYWKYSLIWGIIYNVLYYFGPAQTLKATFSMFANSGAVPETGALTTIMSLVCTVFVLATLVQSIAVGVRRLHDTGRTGLLYLVCVIPFIGWIILLIFFCQDSNKGPNQYGPSPKYDRMD